MSNNQLDLEQCCPICETKSKHIFVSKHKRPVQQCVNDICGHFFTQITKQNQGVCERDENLERTSDESLTTFDERNVNLLNLFNGYLGNTQKPIKFLDFGAGNAHISRTFKRVLKNDCIIYCLEPNPLCAGFYPKYELIQVKSIDEVPEKIDFIYMIEVIEHLDDPIAVLKKLKSILKPEGVIFISTPLGKSIESSTNAYDTQSHIHFFTMKSLNLTLKKAGFTEIKYQYYPQMYPLPLKSKLLQRTIGIAKSIVHSLLAATGSQKAINHLVGLTKKLD